MTSLGPILTKRKIELYASELAALMGLNPYEPVDKSWNKIYQRVKGGKELLATNGILAVQSDRQTIKAIQAVHNISIAVEPVPIAKSSISTLQESKKRAHSQIEANTTLSNQERETLTKAINSQFNKDFGTQAESGLLSVAERLIGKPVRTLSGRLSRILFETNEWVWMLVGRVDGITEDGEVVEIKTRATKLAWTVREYERIQMYSYLFMLESPSGYLVEGLKNQPNNPQCNLERITWDPFCWQRYVDKLRPNCQLWEELWEKPAELFAKLNNNYD